MGDTEEKGAGLNKEQDALKEMMRLEREQKIESRKQKMGCLMVVGILGAICAGLGIWFTMASDAALGPMMASPGDTVIFAIAVVACLGIAVWAWFSRRA